MLDDVQLNPDLFLARQLYSAAISTKGRIVIGGITIARFLGAEPNLEDQVSGSEQPDQAAFEIINYCKVEAGRLISAKSVHHFSVILLHF